MSLPFPMLPNALRQLLLILHEQCHAHAVFRVFEVLLLFLAASRNSRKVLHPTHRSACGLLRLARPLFRSHLLAQIPQTPLQALRPGLPLVAVGSIPFVVSRIAGLLSGDKAFLRHRSALHGAIRRALHFTALASRKLRQCFQICQVRRLQLHGVIRELRVEG
eukprot:scaffold1340_cov253-Pinguiococcus_pyrenoidosus.AAC.15